MISEPYTHPLALQPPSAPLLDILRQLLSSNEHQKAQSSLNIIAARDPKFVQTIIRIISSPEVPPEIKLVSSTYLSQLIQQNIATTASAAQFQLLIRILKDQAIELPCRLSFGRCVKAVVEAGRKCAKVEELLNLTQELFEGDESGKVLAMTVMECEATGEQPSSDFIYYVNAVFLPIAKRLLPLASQAFSEVLLNWAKAAVFVIDKLTINASTDEFNTSSIDMISYICSSQDLSGLILRCYDLSDQADTANQMKGNVGLLHRKLVSHVLKVDEKCTSVHFKDLQRYLPYFCQTLYDTQRVLANQEFCISILGIISLCASHRYFNALFVEGSAPLIRSILPLFRFDENDVYNFQNEPSEFLSYLDDICEQKTSETLKCQAARLLTSLVGNVDGVTTYVYRLGCDSLRARMQGTTNPHKVQLEVDEALLIMTVTSFVLKDRQDIRTQILGLLTVYQQQFLTQLTDIEMTMLFFFLSYSYKCIFQNSQAGIPYMVSACTPLGNPTVDYIGLDFISNQLQSNIHLLKHMTERLRTEELPKYEKTYSNYLKSILKELSEDDLIYVATTLMQRIKQEIQKNKTSHNMFLAFNIITIITQRFKPLLQDNQKLRNHLKMLYPLLSNPKFQCVQNVLDVLNHILLAQKHPTTEEYNVLRCLRAIMEEEGTVQTVFVTLCLFVRKMPTKEKWEISGYVLQLITIACTPTSKSWKPADIGQGLLLMQLFVRKFCSIFSVQTKKQLLKFLRTINLSQSPILKARLINVQLKLYPSYQSPQFKHELIESISITQSAFSGHQRRSLIQGICQMILCETEKSSFQQLLFIAARQLNEYKMQLERQEKSHKKKGGQEKRIDEREEMERSAKRMLQFSKKQDVFMQFRECIAGIRQHNQSLFNSALSQLPQYLVLVLKEMASLIEVATEARVVHRIKSVKEQVNFYEEPESDEDRDKAKGKRKLITQ